MKKYFNSKFKYQSIDKLNGKSINGTKKTNNNSNLLFGHSNDDFNGNTSSSLIIFI